MDKLVVWYNPNKKSYYYRRVRGIFYERYDYVVGAKNAYDHIIVLIIPINDLELTPTYKSIKKSIINKAISFLKKI